VELSKLLGSLRFEQSRDARARKFVATLMTDPPDADAHALAAVTDADEDHARWELRYARRAIGQLIAQRDALDDRTASDVAAALADAHRTDPHVAPERRAISDRQFNDRLRAYGNALADRSGKAGTSERFGRALLTFALAPAMGASAVALASELCAAMVLESNAALREIYGEAALPEDRRPSEL
jgi:hypothetical protein